MRGIVPLPVFIFIYLLVKSLDWKNNNTSGIKFKITRNDFLKKKDICMIDSNENEEKNIQNLNEIPQKTT